jgi:hypothetical protein
LVNLVAPDIRESVGGDIFSGGHGLKKHSFILAISTKKIIFAENNSYNMKVEEPAVAYNTSGVQGLKDRIIQSLSVTSDIRKLSDCLDILQSEDMPGIYTDEEFKEELRLSEASGYVTHEEALQRFAKWGYVR